jgi:hypothetical protein
MAGLVGRANPFAPDRHGFDGLFPSFDFQLGKFKRMAVH